MAKSTKRTIVQHSGWGYAQNPEFARAVESRLVPLESQEKAIIKAGGLLFDNYNAAEDFCELANYRPGNPGLIPSVRGSFADLEVDGLKVYVPLREVVG